MDSDSRSKQNQAAVRNLGDRIADMETAIERLTGVIEVLATEADLPDEQDQEVRNIVSRARRVARGTASYEGEAEDD